MVSVDDSVKIDINFLTAIIYSSDCLLFQYHSLDVSRKLGNPEITLAVSIEATNTIEQNWASF